MLDHLMILVFFRCSSTSMQKDLCKVCILAQRKKEEEKKKNESQVLPRD